MGEWGEGEAGTRSGVNQARTNYACPCDYSRGEVRVYNILSGQCDRRCEKLLIAPTRLYYYYYTHAG